MIKQFETYRTLCNKLSFYLALALLTIGSGTANAADPVKGSRLYAMQCASCHGATGISMMPGSPSFARGERMMQPDSILQSSIQTGKNAMPAYRGILSDTDILDVIAFLRTLH